MLLYPAVFTQGECYITVTFPDIPSAITQGETQEEAFEIVQEVLGFALEDYEKHPKASDIVELQKQHPESTIAVIGIDMAVYNRKYHSKKTPLCSKITVKEVPKLL
ncbi:type II toxin-antitoxin system HicB family antitoxin [Enterococcus cecorum]|uniref:HicB-like antitoxin of toxin-antitoxin system domain-containing protein n=1 Tax=Enterococcus cecorum TaxID=44008 RepID=A0A366SJL0_9ENTE|nr:type II toxin-antitoxin system HicB family antitoxin [Enterococcus cecorum]RBR31673.1 hypothetical protein EB18_00095 [Enterococcus cecorum]